VTTVRRIDRPIDTRAARWWPHERIGVKEREDGSRDDHPAERTLLYPWIRGELFIRTLTGRTRWDRLLTIVAARVPLL
jgi:hypothetical protein